MDNNWKNFLNKLPDDIANNILKLVFEKKLIKAKKDLFLEYESVKNFIYYLITKPA